MRAALAAMPVIELSERELAILQGAAAFLQRAVQCEAEQGRHQCIALFPALSFPVLSSASPMLATSASSTLLHFCPSLSLRPPEEKQSSPPT